MSGITVDTSWCRWGLCRWQATVTRDGTTCTRIYCWHCAQAKRKEGEKP